MLLVIDSNEYIFAFGPFAEEAPKILFDIILEKFPTHSIRIPRKIAEEVRQHLTGEVFREIINFITSITIIDEDFIVPFETGAKYETMGLKASDAFIAAYTEYIGADLLVTENRHFLNFQTNLPFKIVTADECIRILK